MDFPLRIRLVNKSPLEGQSLDRRRQYQRQHKADVEHIEVNQQPVHAHPAPRTATSRRYNASVLCTISASANCCLTNSLPRAAILVASSPSCNNRITAFASP